jgi:hypothetical protein
MSTNDEAIKDIKKAKAALDFIGSSAPVEEIKYPDAKKHKYVSFAKSAIRIIACGFLAYYEIQTAAVLFAFAELLGIAEEIV